MPIYDSWEGETPAPSSYAPSSTTPSSLELGTVHEDNTIMQEISEVEAFHRAVESDNENEKREKEGPPSPAQKQGIKRQPTRQALKLQGWRLFLTLPRYASCQFELEILKLIESSVLIALLLATMDSSIVSTALVTIGNYFDNFAQTIWIVLGYLLSYMSEWPYSSSSCFADRLSSSFYDVVVSLQRHFRSKANLHCLPLRSSWVLNRLRPCSDTQRTHRFSRPTRSRWLWDLQSGQHCATRNYTRSMVLPHGHGSRRNLHRLKRPRPSSWRRHLGSNDLAMAVLSEHTRMWSSPPDHHLCVEGQ